MTLKRLKWELISTLKDLDLPDLEARLIIRHVLSLSDMEQIIRADDGISDEDAVICLDLARKRINGTPMSYITGKKEFYGLEFTVNENVLIPRPETEILVFEAISYLKGITKPVVLDLCTGSGCIAASVQKNIPDAEVCISDISKEALETALSNFKRLTGKYPKAFLGDLFSPIESNLLFDAICTNPPYIAEKWYDGLEKDVKKEPQSALIGGGEDGLDIIRRIISESGRHIKRGGLLIIEADYRQISAIKNLMEQNGFTDVSAVKDLAGKERCVRGIFQSS